MRTCREYQECIERFIDGNFLLTDEMEVHLMTCSQCREYKESLECIAEALNGMKLPPPPPQLVDDVMFHIYARERRRVVPTFIPGLFPILCAWKTLLRYVSSIKIPRVLQREGWPLVFATLAVIWGVLIMPALEAGADKSTLQRSVSALADKLRIEGEKFSASVNSIIPDLFGDRKAQGIQNESSEPSNGPSKPEKLINMINSYNFPPSKPYRA
ncbi:MAG: hypothetical protein C4527_19555 [Candidatus Omnitrophota bacterium]|jgi:hypothetical protein|nr:MAG: hypothetical protein C4527_19555 [Candidatus Omnitrophota bacterium]